jgi:hypothetical protein
MQKLSLDYVNEMIWFRDARGVMRDQCRRCSSTRCARYCPRHVLGHHFKCIPAEPPEFCICGCGPDCHDVLKLEDSCFQKEIETQPCPAKDAILLKHKLIFC